MLNNAQAPTTQELVSKTPKIPVQESMTLTTHQTFSNLEFGKKI
jgi:hypothetical protein